MNIKKKKLNTGVLTIELLIAFAILLINVTGILLLTSGNQSTVVSAETNAEALSLAQQEIEKAKATAEGDFHVLSDYEGIEYPSGSLTYTKTLDIVPVADDDDTPWDESLFMNKVTSVIEWMGEKNQLKSVELTTIISNPEALGGGDTCSSILVGDWSKPVMIPEDGYEFGKDILELTGSEASGFPITSIQTFNKRMYVTIDHDNGQNLNTFFILDIIDPEQKPIPLGWLDNNSSSNKGLSSVAVDGGDYAYVANSYSGSSPDCEEAENCGQLQVIDISNPETPSVVRNFKLDSVTTSGTLAYGTSIFYKDEVVYLGLAKADGDGEDYPNGLEFYALDVSTPTSPVILASAEIGNGVNSILIKDEYAYVVSPSDEEELKVFNLSNLNQIGAFDAPAGGGNNGNGKSIYIVGNTLYLGRTLLAGDEFYILNNEEPGDYPTASILGSKNIQDGDDDQPPAPKNTSIKGLIIRGDLAIFVTDEEFQVWRIDSLPAITRYADPLILPPGTGGPNLEGVASDCEGNYIYVGSLGANDKGIISVVTGGPEE